MKQEIKLYKALRLLLHNSVAITGYPKKATVIQLRKAQKVLTAYEKQQK